MQLDTQAPTYFVAPNFYPTQNAGGTDVEDPAKLTKVGVRGEVTVDEIDKRFVTCEFCSNSVENS